MMDDMFGNINLLQKGLDAAWLRNRVITNNIANVDTVNFKSSSVEFESEMRDALQREADGFSVDAAQEVTPRVVQNTATSYRSDGNNVDIDYENTEMAKNVLWYNVMVEQLSSEITRLKTAISG